MKILINMEPIGVCEEFLPSLDLYIATMGGVFSKIINNNECKILISERLKYQARASNYKLGNAICIEDSEYYKVFNDEYISRQEIVNNFYFGCKDINIQKGLTTLYKSHLEDFEPDLIISFEFHNKIFDFIYPKALQIVYAGGILKGGFLPSTLIFDPVGSLKTSFFNVYKDEINSINLTEKQNEIINKFKNDFSKTIKEYSPIKDIISYYKEKFDYLLLLPCQFSDHHAYDSEIGFKKQFDMVNWVLSKVPDNVGVIVTEHKHYMFINEGKFIKGGFLNWFKNKYPNFIFIEELNNYPSASMFLLPEIDGVINVSSTVGLQAILFDKKVFSIAYNYNNLFKDAQGLDDMISNIKAPLRDKNKLIYWFLTRYTFYPFEFNDESWLKNFFEKSIDKFKTTGINYNFYSKNTSLNKACNYIITTTKTNLEHAFNKLKSTSISKPTLLHQIFSVKNEYNHKVLRIFGFKIKLKRK